MSDRSLTATRRLMNPNHSGALSPSAAMIALLVHGCLAYAFFANWPSARHGGGHDDENGIEVTIVMEGAAPGSLESQGETATDADADLPPSEQAAEIDVSETETTPPVDAADMITAPTAERVVPENADFVPTDELAASPAKELPADPVQDLQAGPVLGETPSPSPASEVAEIEPDVVVDHLSPEGAIAAAVLPNVNDLQPTDVPILESSVVPTYEPNEKPTDAVTVAEPVPTPPPPKPAPPRVRPPEPRESEMAQSAPGDGGQGGDSGKSLDQSNLVSAPAGSPDVPPDYQAQLLAWLEQHKSYPRSARSRRQEGVVLLQFIIDREGRVLQHHIKTSSGFRLLDRAVEEMIEDAQPLPAMPPEMKIAQMEFVLPVRFDLE